jgi:hypothetical protein
LLKISEDLKNVATLDTILKLRDLWLLETFTLNVTLDTILKLRDLWLLETFTLNVTLDTILKLKINLLSTKYSHWIKNNNLQNYLELFG